MKSTAHRNLSHRVAASLVVALGLGACGTDPGRTDGADTGSPDSAIDAGADAQGSDVVGDDASSTVDAGIDTGVDVAPDVPGTVDAGTDVGPDTIEPREVGTDPVSPPDVGVDTGVDTGVADATCFDFEQNGDETGRDCGGSCVACLPTVGCAAACDERATVLGGGCDPNGSACVDQCEALTAEWGPQVGAAVEVCFATNYLCFESLEDCVRTAMYPDPFDHDVVVRLSGLDAWDGLDVLVGIEQSPDVFVTRGATLVGGAAEIRVPVTMSMRVSHLALITVDVDGDGLCDAEGDLAYSEAAVSWEQSAVFGVPSFVVEAGPDELTTGRYGFVCDSL